MKNELLKLSTWALRLQHALDVLMKTGKFRSQDDVASAAEIFYKRLLAIYKYSPSRKYIGVVTLLRAMENTDASEHLGKDYGLGEASIAM